MASASATHCPQTYLNAGPESSRSSLSLASRDPAYSPGLRISTLALILLFGAGMSVIALVGGITLVLPEERFRAVVLALVALAAGSLSIDIAIVLPFAAGNFLYIAAADLIPQLRSGSLRGQLAQFGALLLGLGLLLGVTAIRARLRLRRCRIECAGGWTRT